MNEYPNCDSLWLPPCPCCSWISPSRRAALDMPEAPGFYLARHTTGKYGHNYYMLRGCSHATGLGVKLGPLRNRLYLAVRWRRKCATMVETLFRVGWSETERAIALRRLGHPSQYCAEDDPVPPPAPGGASVFGELNRQVRQPYAD